MKSKPDLPPSRTAEQFVVRFPDGMREKIAELAKANGRSMNAEIINRLEQSFLSESFPGLMPAARDEFAALQTLMRTIVDERVTEIKENTEAELKAKYKIQD